MSRKQTPLRPYFEKMPEIGKELREGEVRRSRANVALVREQEEIIALEVLRVKNAGIPAETSTPALHRTRRWPVVGW